MLSPQACLQQAGFDPEMFEVTPCHTGLSHRHYQLSGPQQLFLRLYSEQQRPWLDVTHEQQVMKSAADTGLAPELVYLDPKQRFFLSRYVAHQVKSHYSPQQLLQLLEQLITLPMCRPMILHERYQLYCSAALAFDPKLELCPQWQWLQQQLKPALEALTDAPVGKAFIDWHEFNLLASSKQVYLIDYEYACIAPLALELASLQCSQLIAKSDWPEFKTGFEQLHKVTISESQLKAAKVVYLGFCYLWYPANGLEDKVEQARLLKRLKSIN